MKILTPTPSSTVKYAAIFPVNVCPGATWNRKHRFFGELIVTHATDAASDTLDTANTQSVYEVSRADLPLSCPTHEQKLWNSHPRVYLAIEETGEATCPYCSAQYILLD